MVHDPYRPPRHDVLRAQSPPEERGGGWVYRTLAVLLGVGALGGPFSALFVTDGMTPSFPGSAPEELGAACFLAAFGPLWGIAALRLWQGRHTGWWWVLSPLAVLFVVSLWVGLQAVD